MKVEYIGGAWTPEQLPDQALPEVAFLGRSNVGKSTLINALVGRRRIAHTSRTPGRTQAIHFFQVADKLCLVDLPGYGYAKVPAEIRRAWRPLVDGYLVGRKQLAGGVLLADVRRDPREDEHRLVDLLVGQGTPLLIVVTKTDKLARTRVGGRLQQLASQLKVPPSQVLGFSALKGEGKDSVWSAVMRLADAAHRP